MTTTMPPDARCPRCGRPYRFDFATMMSNPSCTCPDNPELVASAERDERRMRKARAEALADDAAGRAE